MNLCFEVVASDQATPSLRADLLETWVAVTNAGGSVGFTAPAPMDAVATELDRALDRVTRGTDVLAVLRTEGRAAGMGMLVSGESSLTAHWRTVLRVMVHPEFQGRGAGDLLMHGLHSTAAGLGLQQLKLTVRDGEQLETFYARHGYQVVGRHPAALRVADREYRDEVILVAALPVPARDGMAP